MNENFSSQQVSKYSFNSFADFARAYGKEAITASINGVNTLTLVAHPTAPRLCDIDSLYGHRAISAWINSLLVYTFGLTNLQEDEKTTLGMVSDVLYEKFRFEKCSVFILFLGKCMGREFKIAYGKFSPDPILEAANTFVRELLPQLKYRARIETGKADEASVIKPFEAWRAFTLRSRWIVMREALFNLWEARGSDGFVEAIVKNDEWHDAVGSCLGIGAIVIWYGETRWDNEAFERHVSCLPDEDILFQPQRASYRDFPPLNRAALLSSNAELRIREKARAEEMKARIAAKMMGLFA